MYIIELVSMGFFYQIISLLTVHLTLYSLSRFVYFNLNCSNVKNKRHIYNIDFSEYAYVCYIRSASNTDILPNIF